MDYTVQVGPDGRPWLGHLIVDIANTYAPEKRLPGHPVGYYAGGRWNPLTHRLDHRDGYYGGYTRVYLPPGSEVMSISGLEDATVAEESGKTVVGGFVELLGGEKRQVVIQWRPSSITMSEPGVYRLLAPRQPGAPQRSLAVHVGASAVQPGEAHPAFDKAPGSPHTWTVSLERDAEFEYRLTR
jgi:hypothetical protein